MRTGGAAVSNCIMCVCVSQQNPRSGIGGGSGGQQQGTNENNNDDGNEDDDDSAESSPGEDEDDESEVSLAPIQNGGRWLVFAALYCCFCAACAPSH